jgi:asparagine synthase (glutamine-hydrolysing)
MPGIAGLAGHTADGSLLGPMLDRLTHHDWYTRDAWADADGSVALGRVSLGFVDTAPQPARIAEGPKWAVLTGEIYDYATRRRALEAKGRDFRGDGHAELLLHGLEADGTAFLRSLDGCFAAAVWDAADGTLRLVNDRFGMRPLYYAHLPGRLVFGSEVKALLADPGVSRAPDPRGLAQFFCFGQYLGETTSFADLRLLPATGVLTYTAADGRLDLTRYARLGESWKLSPAGTPELLERIDAAFVRSVERSVEGTAPRALTVGGSGRPDHPGGRPSGPAADDGHARHGRDYRHPERRRPVRPREPAAPHLHARAPTSWDGTSATCGTWCA